MPERKQSYGWYCQFGSKALPFGTVQTAVAKIRANSLGEADCWEYGDSTVAAFATEAGAKMFQRMLAGLHMPVHVQVRKGLPPGQLPESLSGLLDEGLRLLGDLFKVPSEVEIAGIFLVYDLPDPERQLQDGYNEHVVSWGTGRDGQRCAMVIFGRHSDVSRFEIQLRRWGTTYSCHKSIPVYFKPER